MYIDTKYLMMQKIVFNNSRAVTYSFTTCTFNNKYLATSVHIFGLIVATIVLFDSFIFLLMKTEAVKYSINVLCNTRVSFRLNAGIL